MPSCAPDELPLRQVTDTYSARFAEWGALTVGYEKAPAGMDAQSSLVVLPGNRCQANHWGYLISGRMRVDYVDRHETIEGGQAYHVEPGHLITFEEDTEAVEFTPTSELEQTLSMVRKNAGCDPSGD